MYAQIINDNVVRTARRLPDKVWLPGPSGTDGTYAEVNANNAADYGWFPLDTSAPQPDETATTRYERSVSVVDGVAVVGWDPIVKTQTETDAWNAAQADEQERATVRQAVAYLGRVIDGEAQFDPQVAARILRRLIVDQYGEA